MTDLRPTDAPDYLNPSTLPLVIDPADLGAEAGIVISELLTRNPADAATILQGAALLFAADAGTPAECLATSMTWLYG
ncbi:hypothetical protein [Amycolatopsis sp. NPDC003731]